jgi:NAD-dependent deacetylase
MSKRIVVLTGAGISAESGISTFRDAGGLWEGHDIYEVATPEGFAANPELVLDFYNKRRAQLLACQPNAAHYALAELERKYDVTVITQNVDDLHERAGSTNIIHLHGELLKVRSTVHPHLVYQWEKDLHSGDLCEKGKQLRPHIVWFGEAVPMIDQAVEVTRRADIFLVVGTSLVVYPAAGLVHYTDFMVPRYVVDPDKPEVHLPNTEYITENATTGVRKLVDRLMGE